MMQKAMVIRVKRRSSASLGSLFQHQQRLYFISAHRPESKDGWLNVALGDDESDCLQQQICQTQSMNPKSASGVASKAVKMRCLHNCLQRDFLHLPKPSESLMVVK